MESLRRWLTLEDENSIGSDQIDNKFIENEGNEN